MSDDLCKVCGKAPVAGCINGISGSGGGVLPVVSDQGVTVLRPCPNMRRVVLKQFLQGIDPQLVRPSIKHRQDSPLYQPKRLDSEKIDRTSENLFFEALDWSNFLGHLKWVAACKGVDWFPRIVSDMTLINIFVGNTSSRTRALGTTSAKGLIEANSLEDHLVPPDLVILKLGKIIHPNRAAANVFTEAVLMRLSEGKPTWIVEPPDQSFLPYNKPSGIGMVCCNDENYRLIKTDYTTCTLDESGDGSNGPSTGYVESTQDNVAIVAPKVRTTHSTPTQDSPLADSIASDLDSAWSSAEQRKRNKKAKW